MDVFLTVIYFGLLYLRLAMDQISVSQFSPPTVCTNRYIGVLCPFMLVSGIITNGKTDVSFRIHYYSLFLRNAWATSRVFIWTI